MTNKEIAEKILAAADLHESSYDHGSYQIKISDAINKIFGDDPMGKIYQLALYLSWNDTIQICDSILKG
jgi:hypothetical protein